MSFSLFQNYSKPCLHTNRDISLVRFVFTYFLSLDDIETLRVAHDWTVRNHSEFSFARGRAKNRRETKKLIGKFFFFLILFEKSLVEKLSSENTEKIRKFYEEAAFTLDAFFSIKMLRIIFKINAYN